MKFLLAGLLALGLTSGAHAVTTYTYKGQNYTEIKAPSYLTPDDYEYYPYKFSMGIMGNIVFSDPLPANSHILALEWSWSYGRVYPMWAGQFSPDFVSATFNDGRRDYTFLRTADIFEPIVTDSHARLELLTDNAGNISSWDIWISPNTYKTPQIEVLTARNLPGHQILDEVFYNPHGYYEDLQEASLGRNFVAGSWTASTSVPVVPLPPAVILLGSGLLALFALRRRVVQPV